MENCNREDRLLKVLANVNDWLKFAESKNTTLIAFNGASIFGVSQLYQLELVKGSDILKVYFFIVIALLIFSTVISMMSFVPRMKILRRSFKEQQSIRNSLFYEHLKGRSDIQIAQEVCETDAKEFKQFELDVANQIRQNSNIASVKFSYFSVAIWFTVAAWVTFPLAFIFWLYNTIDKSVDSN